MTVFWTVLHSLVRTILNADSRCTNLEGVMMDLMLDVKSNAKNPLIDFHSVNDFAIRSLMKLDVELFSKENREHVLTSWRPLLAEDPKAAALEPAVLALKIKLMHRSVFYEVSNVTIFGVQSADQL